jgi:predicted glycoside hydrolase/deacetylase ChbG (UPF0249 family)
MAGGGAFDDAVRLAMENPSLDIGVHVVLVGLPGFPQTVAELVRAVALRRVRLYDEIASQVRKILDTGLPVTHMDTHKHTHLLPQVLDAVARVSEDFRIPWVRRPFGPLKAFSPGVLRRRGCRTTDHFAGFRITGKFDTPALAALIRALPPGSTEFMCHPGRCTGELRAARTRLKESRERELRALTSPEVRQAIEESGVRLVSFRDL